MIKPTPLTWNEIQTLCDEFEEKYPMVAFHFGHVVIQDDNIDAGMIRKVLKTQFTPEGQPHPDWLEAIGGWERMTEYQVGLLDVAACFGFLHTLLFICVAQNDEFEGLEDD